MNFPIYIMLFILLFYLWIIRLLISAARSDIPPRGGPPPLPGQLRRQPPPPPLVTPNPFRIYRWLTREVLGGLEGIGVMRALILKELRTMLASRKSFWLLLTLSLVGSGYFIIFWQNNALSITVATRAQYSRAMFSSLFLIQYCGLGLISAFMASATVTTERENKTLDLLLATRLSREQVVLAKWFSNIVYQLVLFASLLPLQALTFQLGGVGLDDYLTAALLISAAIATYGMLGLAVSCHVQRTVTALLLTVCASVLLGLFLPAHQFFRFGSPSGNGFVLLGYLIMLSFFFIVCWRIAWRGLTRRDTFRPAVKKKFIDDRVVIEQRRNQWPFYLIDPLARPQDIGDHQNPVYIKEQRVNPLGRLDVNIRLCYIAMAVSFTLVLAHRLDGSFATFRSIACWVISCIMPFVPVLAATSISKEFEENTLSLLRTTPLTPTRIVWAKYRLTMRFLSIFCVSFMILPAAVHLGMLLTDNTMHHYRTWSEPLAAILKITPALLAWTALYAAISLLCSSLCRRNVTAIVSSYVVMLLLLGSPNILGFLATLLDSGSPGTQGPAASFAVGLLKGIRYYVCPLLSPYFFYGDQAAGSEGHFFNDWENWAQIVLCLLLTGVVVLALIESAKRCLILKSRRS